MDTAKICTECELAMPIECYSIDEDQLDPFNEGEENDMWQDYFKDKSKKRKGGRPKGTQN